MHFGFVLELSNIDLWNIDLLDTHLDLLDTDITSKNFVCLWDVSKASSRYVLKTSSRHVFKTSGRRLQRNNFSSFKMSSRCLQDMSSSKRFYVFQDFTSSKKSSRPSNVCWESNCSVLGIIKTQCGMVSTKKVCRSAKCSLDIISRDCSNTYLLLACKKQKLVQNKPWQQGLFVLISGSWQV